MRKWLKCYLSVSTPSESARERFEGKVKSHDKKHLVSPSVKEKRFERSKKLLSLLKKRPTTILFSDEKLFTVDCLKQQNQSFY